VIMAEVIDGKRFAERLRAEIGRQVARLREQHFVTPGLAVILVGEDPASQVYVRNKAKQAREAAMASFEYRLPHGVPQEKPLELIERLNGDPAVHGILVQLPLPPQVDANRVISAIRPDKDIDGFHPINAGCLATGGDGTVPCTPLGCLMLLKHRLGDLAGLRVLVAAVGRPRMVPGDWIKPGAKVIDVGINRTKTADGKGRLVGDVDFDSAVKVAGAITPVPGGVGPMTIACLLLNTLEAACLQHDLPMPTGLMEVAWDEPPAASAAGSTPRTSYALSLRASPA